MAKKIEVWLEYTDGRVVEQDVEFFQYPAGEYDITQASLDSMWEAIKAGVSVTVVLRSTDPVDIVKAGLISAYYENRSVRTDLAVPYFPASRADKEDGATAVWVYDQLLHSLGFSSVVTLDVHSNFLKDTGSNTKAFRATEATLAAVIKTNRHYDAVIAPDEGARERAGLVAKRLGVPLLVAAKMRDSVGTIVSYHIDAEENKNYLVVDDICDGGATFNTLGQALTDLDDVSLDLWVTHGFFSKGLEDLSVYYDYIMTTDSVRDGYDPFEAQLIVVPCFPYMR